MKHRTRLSPFETHDTGLGFAANLKAGPVSPHTSEKTTKTKGSNKRKRSERKLSFPPLSLTLSLKVSLSLSLCQSLSLSASFCFSFSLSLSLSLSTFVRVIATGHEDRLHFLSRWR